LIPASSFAGPRRALQKVLVHACTYTPITTSETDGDEVSVMGTPVSGIPCRYEAQGAVTRDATGRTIVSGPALTVAHDAVLAVGGAVSSILNSGADMLIAGPLTVARRVDDDPLGLPLLKTYELFGADPQRAS
jgi:hypothetical protein